MKLFPRLFQATIIIFCCTLVAALEPITFTLVDAEATGYGTFQSHNQKVASNKNGIFMTHIRSRNEAYTAQQWRLSRSEDGGATFKTIYEETNATNPPVIETDEAANIYLIRPDFTDGDSYLYRFLAADRYAKPLISKIPKSAAGKYAMNFDPKRRVLYYFAHNDTFHVIGLNGEVKSSAQLITGGPRAVLQYPHLSLAENGTLHAAWTTQKTGVYMYWDIHHMTSEDGGQSWRGPKGTALTLPVVADDSGPTTRLTLDDEFEVHTWLESMFAKGDKVHFAYLAQASQSRQHYVRLDPISGAVEKRIQPEFKGEKVSLMNLDGFFASASAAKKGTLYFVSNQAGYIAALASDDGGETWRDAARGEQLFAPYAIGGCRAITSDGYVIGSFTQSSASTSDTSGKCPVYFFKFKAR